MRSCKLMLIAAAVLSLFTAAFAQQPSGTLSGSVTDPNGALIPGATVTVKNTATGATRTVTTNGEGFYQVTNLPAGSYGVKIEAQGFTAKVTSGDVVIGVGQTVTLNGILRPGELNIEVDLIAEMPLIERETSKVDRVIESREIENLPLNGRNFLELALLTPGNTIAPNFDPTKGNTVVISSAGQLGRGGNVMVDGADNNDDMVGGALINISQDAVQEFQVATNRFSAEYGRSASSVIDIVTKSGSNMLRGSAAAYFRDGRWQELPATADRTQPRPPFDRQQYAFTLGGPFIKDKFFGFGAVEYRDQDGGVQVGIRDVANQQIIRGFAPAPLQNLLLNTRFDYYAGENDRLGFKYAFEDIEATDSSKLDRAIGSGSYLQAMNNRFHSGIFNWNRVFSPTVVNDLSISINNFDNTTDPVAAGRQLTFPSILDGTSFRVPQATKLNRIQIANVATWVTGNHLLKFGGEFQRIDGSLYLGVFQDGRIEFVQDFANQDRNQDGVIDDEDLLFAVTLRSQFPDRPLVLENVDNNHVAFFVQDDWRVRPRLTLNLGLRYELDTNVKNVSGYDDINPLVAGFYSGDRSADYNNFAPRVGFAWAPWNDRFVIRGGYGIYYDRVVLQLITLERGLDGRALPIAVRAGNALTAPDGTPIFLDQNGNFVPGAPTLSNPFSGFILPGAGASGINIIDNDLQNPMVQQSHLGMQWEFVKDYVFKADVVHNFGTHFIIGRDIGTVFNPVVGGPDRVVNLESSVKTFYDALMLGVEKRFASGFGFRSAYTFSKSLNYANDDQVPFANGPIDPNNLRLEYGPSPTDQRHRFTFAATTELPWGIRFAPLLTLASGVPMDILMPDGQSRIPTLQRNAGGRLFKNAAELNAFINEYNAGRPPEDQLPLAPANARFNDNFASLDMRFSKVFTFAERFRLEPMVEIFNVFNTTNILGFSNTNFSGFGNVLGTPSFGQPVTTAGGVFGTGGPRALQLAGRFTF